MTFESAIKKTVFDEMKKFLEEISKIEEELTTEQVNEKLKTFVYGETKTPAVKKERVKTVLVSADRCIARKMDNTRCNGKKHLKGTDPELCVLHNKNGVKNGTIDVNEEVDDTPESEVEKIEEEPKEEPKPKGKGKAKAKAKAVKTLSEETITTENDFEN
jgi:hypothetical protein